MARIKIVTDSTSDISLGMAHELGIEIVPMYLHVGEQTYRAGLDVTPDQFYQMMQDGRMKAMTSSPPPVVFEQLYRRLAPDYVGAGNPRDESADGRRPGTDPLPRRHAKVCQWRDR